MFDINTFRGELTLAIVVWIITGIGSYIGGLIKGKKVSQDGIYVKDNELLPLINELKPYSNYELDALCKIEMKLVDSIALESFNSNTGEELINECKLLHNMVIDYNDIKIINVAHSIIVEQFKKGFVELFGYIIEGVSTHCDKDGNEYEIEHKVEELEIVEGHSHSNEIKTLLINEGMLSHEILVDKEHNAYDYLYKEIVDIYSSALRRRQNNPPKRDVLIDIGELTPAEYIANYDFFEIYNNNEKVVMKYKIREEIILKSQSIIQTAKEMVEKINKQFIAPKL